MKKLNFEAILRMSDFATFLPILNRAKSFFIIKVSIHYELKQFHQKSFYMNIYENHYYSLNQLIPLG